MSPIAPVAPAQHQSEPALRDGNLGFQPTLRIRGWLNAGRDLSIALSQMNLGVTYVPWS